MFRILVTAIVAIAIVRPAAAEPHARIVLADEDPELRRALAGALAPWHVELFVDAIAIRDDDDAIHRAASWNARFVIWRDRGQLVVFDRERALADRRTTRTGALDPADAAAAALTVKTMLRLPPPTDDPIAVPVVAPGGRELRLEVGGAGRIAFASATDLGARQFDAVMFRPTRTLGLRVGVGTQLGSRIAIDAGGFKGTWGDWDADVLASWGLPIVAGWELEPNVGLGLVHDRLDGVIQGLARGEAGNQLAILAGVSLRRHLGNVFTAVANLALRGVPGAETYTATKGKNDTVVFQAPGFTTSLGLALSVDFGL